MVFLLDQFLPDNLALMSKPTQLLPTQDAIISYRQHPKGRRIDRKMEGKIQMQIRAKFVAMSLQKNPILHGVGWEYMFARAFVRCQFQLRKPFVAASIVGIVVMFFSFASVNATTFLPRKSLQTDAGSPQTDQPTQLQIERLIRQLGAPSYGTRQLAMEQLWELGPAAKPALERAAVLADSEVARRAGQILTVLSMGIDKNGSPETAKLVLEFQSSEQSVRMSVLRRLFKNGKIQLTFDLMQQVKDKTDRGDLFDSVISLDDELIALARADDWEDFEFILSHPLTMMQRPDAAVLYHLLNGTLDARARAMQGAIQSQEEAGKKPGENELKRLIAIYRLQEKFGLATKFAQKITEPGMRNGLKIQILKEQGAWKQLAAKMAKPDENLGPNDEKFDCTPAQRALVLHMVEDQVAYQETIKSLSEKASTFEKENEETEASSLRETLVQIGMSNLDWQLVTENLDPANKTQAFWIHSTNNRAMQAFKIVGLGGTVEERERWIDRRIRFYNSLKTKSQRLYSAGQDNDEVDARKSEVWGSSVAIAGLLGELGHRDEAVLFFQSLFATLDHEDQIYSRCSIIQALIELECFDAAWNLIEHGIDPAKYSQMLMYLVPTRSASARYWFQRLQTRYADPLKRLKVTMGIVNSPLGTSDEFDLSVELAAGLSTISGSSITEFQLSKVYEYHGDLDRSRRCLVAARDLGYGAATQGFAIDAIKQGEYEVALAFFDADWRARKGSLQAILAAEAFRKTGQLHKAMLRQCLAYAFWSDSYRTTSTVNALEAMEHSHLLTAILKLETIDMFGNSNSVERYRDELAKSQEKKNPAMRAVNLQLALFASLSDELDSQMIGFWSDTRKNIDFALAKTLIQANKVDEAYQLAANYNQFCPGDPDVAEQIVGLLDQAGASSLSNKLFEDLTQHFVELLQQYPDSSAQHNNYAWACACAKRGTERMLRHALKACKLRPYSSSAFDTLAEVYFLRGDREKAVELYKRCIQLDPSKQHYRDQLIRFKTLAIDAK